MRFFVLGYAVAAGWLALSRLHRLQSCDSLIFGLASTAEWAPFFWEQDRVGLLLPLLAAPVRDPLANLLLLTGLMSFAGLLAPLLMAWVVVPRRAAYAAVTLGNAALLAAGPGVLHENLFVACNYPLALCLGLPAVRLLDRPAAGRVVLAGGLLLAAHWVYLGVAVFLVPLAGGRWLVRPSWRRFWAAGRVGVGVVVGIGVMTLAAGEWRRLHPEIEPTPASGLPPADWPGCWLAFLQALVGLDGFAPWAGAVVGLMLAGGVGSGRRVRPAVVRLVLPLVLAAAAELLLLGTRAWPAMNQHHPRYLLAGVAAVWVAAVVAVGLPAVRRVSPRLAGLAPLALLLAAVGWRYGLPSVGSARAELDAVAGRDTADLLACGADGFGGEYMAAWPGVWHANMTLATQGDGRTLVGVTARSAPWAWRWRDGPLSDGFRLAAPFDQEGQTRRWVTHHGLAVVAGPERFGRLIVFDVRPVRPR